MPAAQAGFAAALGAPGAALPLAAESRDRYIGGTARGNRFFSLISALVAAFAQLSDPPIRRVVWLSIGLALAVLVALGVAIWVVVALIDPVSTPWLDWLIWFGTGLGLILLAWLLFPAAVSATIGLFLESVAEAVEARHYPGLEKPRAQPVHEAIIGGLKFALIALLLNLVALPVYLAAIFIPPLYFFVFYGLNGYLLGREYFEMVALRRLGPHAAAELRRKEWGRVYLAGVVITVLLTVPILNLIAPVIATGFMLHLFEAMQRPAMRA